MYIYIYIYIYIIVYIIVYRLKTGSNIPIMTCTVHVENGGSNLIIYNFQNKIKMQ